MEERYCGCGCGGEITVWKNNRQGQFLRGHHMKKPPHLSSPLQCACGCGDFTKIQKSGKISTYINGHQRKLSKEKTLCLCGCGELANFGKTYVHGHHVRHKKYALVPTTTSYCQCGCGAELNAHANGHVNQYLKGHHLKGKKLSIEHITTRSLLRWGRASTLSPYLPNVTVTFSKRQNRWIACLNSTSILHAKAVYEHFNGKVPSGFHVHHKNGDPSKLEHDHPDNLMLLPAEWNLRFLPVLAKGFGISEEVVTNAYIAMYGDVPEEQLFAAICERLLNKKDTQ